MKATHAERENWRTQESKKFILRIPRSFIWGLLVGVLLTVVITSSEVLDRDFHNSLAPEAVGILVTVFVIDQLYQRQATAFLWEANLQAANLYKANLSEADMWKTDLQAATLSGANLQKTKLQYANLHSALLHKANLYEADLGYANLQKADLWDVILQKANVWNVDFRGANLSGASLRGVLRFGDAIFDESTILPNGDKWHDGYDLTIFTDPEHPNF